MTATRSLDDVEHIRRLLTPERTARRPVPAQSRPSFIVEVDDRPVRVYADDATWRDGFLERVRQARADLGRHRPLVGELTPQQRAERTQRALDSLAGRGIVEPPARLSSVFRLTLDGRLGR